jgi:hypothetical protein
MPLGMHTESSFKNTGNLLGKWRMSVSSFALETIY